MIVAFYSHCPQSGKSSAAAWLRDHRGYKIAKFADGIRQMLVALLEMCGYNSAGAHDLIFDDQHKEQSLSLLAGSPTPRSLMKSLGTQWGRELVNPDLWATALIGSMDQRPKQRNFAIDDLRFPNEWKVLKNAGATIVKVEREGFPIEESLCEGLLKDYEPDFVIRAKDVSEIHAQLELLFPKETT